jgi:hypothetical protein
MRDEYFVASIKFLIELGECCCMALRVPEHGCMLVRLRSMCMAKNVRPLRANGNLEPFHGFAHEPSQNAVETIQFPKALECRARNKPVRIILFHEDKAESGQAIVIVVFETVQRMSFVQNEQATSL